MRHDDPKSNRYPLVWPENQARTPASQRRESDFKLEFGRARDELFRELNLMRAREVILSTDVPLRLDGLPYANEREPNDPGVALYFTKGKQRVAIACDSYRRVRENLRALGETIKAMRAIERHGATSLLERAFMGFAALPPKSQEWHEVLGVAATAPFDVVRAAYKALALKHHPDRADGSVEEFQRVQRAWDSFEGRR